jgi:hypothetical protein
VSYRGTQQRGKEEAVGSNEIVSGPSDQQEEHGEGWRTGLHHAAGAETGLRARP